MAEAQSLEGAMSEAQERTRAGLVALGCVLLLSLIGDWLFYSAGVGLNLPLWSAGVALGWLVVARTAHLPLSRTQWWLVGAAWLFTLMVAWRDSITLNVLTVLTALLLIGLSAYPWAQGVTRGSVLEYCLLMPLYQLALLMGGLPTLVLGDVRWRSLGGLRSMQALRLALTGLLLAFPFLLLFFVLFASADAVYLQIVRNLFQIDLDAIVQHFLLIVLFGWLAGSLLRMLLWREEFTLTDDLQTPRVGAVEMGIALGLINLLFLSFVVVQIRYLFGGASLVQVTPNLTYSEYARQGFGQLVVASLFVLPMLLLFDWLIARNRVARRTFQGLAALLLVLLSIVMASAWHRLMLYQQAYGLTELRVYAAASMVWLGLTLLWFLLTVLPGRRERFSFGATMLAAIVVVGLHLINPDALIARVNLTRALEGKPLDVNYVTSLSADSLPAIRELLPRLPASHRQAIIERLRQHPLAQSTSDWRDWNWSRTNAKRHLTSLLHDRRGH